MRTADETNRDAALRHLRDIQMKRAAACLLFAAGLGAQVTAPTIPLAGGFLNTADGVIELSGGQLSFAGWPSQVFSIALIPPTGNCLPQQIFTIVAGSNGYSLYACLNWEWTLVAAPPLTFAQEYEYPGGTLGLTDGKNRVFTLAFPPAPPPAAGPQVFLNGVKQRPGADYAIAGQRIQFSEPLQPGTSIEADYYH